MFLVLEPSNEYYTMGQTLQEAYQAFIDNYGNFDLSDLQFYDLPNPLKVEIKVVPVTTIVKTQRSK